MASWLEEDHWAHASEGYDYCVSVPNSFLCLPFSTTGCLVAPAPHHQLVTREPGERIQDTQEP